MTVISNRSCGNCTVCCKMLGVPEIKKPIGKWCPHRDANKGCRIYLKHPPSCRLFKCEWLKGFGRDEDRPNHTKIILALRAGYEKSTLPEFLQIWEVSGKALREPFAKESVRFFIEKGIPVLLVHISGKLELVTGNIILLKESLEKFKEGGIEIIQKY